MDTLSVGMAIWISAAGVAPAPSPSFTPTVPVATTLTLREAAARASIPASSPLVAHQRQSARVSHFSTTTRIIAMAAGGAGGFLAGGHIGCRLAGKRDDDGVGCLRGVVIGAPIGAVVGAVAGYVLTK